MVFETEIDRVRIEEVRCNVSVREKMNERLDRKF